LRPLAGPGLKAAIREVLTEAVWQRCYVHFLRNALDYVPRKVDDDGRMMESRWFHDWREPAEVRRDLAACWPNSRANIRSCAHGSRTTSRKR
jgi:transposase-like protein